jgi:protocatechuate 3,4-dioxygenase beta subunit
MKHTEPDPPFDTGRRRMLGTLLLSSMAPAALSKEATAEAPAPFAPRLLAPDVCPVMPATTEGPYYLDPRLVRSDIAEGRPGVPLRLKLQIVGADCRPLPSARVDIWHCDAQGNYSGYAGQGSDATLDTRGQIFLRGVQITDDRGVVVFDTIYPGWYRGRTTHIHCKVFLDKKTVLTSQIFFPDALSEYLYEHAPDYRRAQPRDMVNAIDFIGREAGETACCCIQEQTARYVAALVIGVDPAAEWSEQGQGMPGLPMRAPPPKSGRPPLLPPTGPLGGGPMFEQRTETTRMFPGK